jgi:hypothetical protein
MSAIEKTTTISEEVRRGEIFGAVKLYNTWEPIFTRLGRDDLLTQVRDHPTGDQIHKLVGDRPLIVILDELESWFSAIEDPARRERNLNFLQNLTEMAQDQSLKLIVLASLYGRNPQLLGRMGRERMFLKDLEAEEDKARVVLFRLFEEIDQDEARRTVDSYVAVFDTRKTCRSALTRGQHGSCGTKG